MRVSICGCVRSPRVSLRLNSYQFHLIQTHVIAAPVVKPVVPSFVSS
jgi:hypothetical protein